MMFGRHPLLLVPVLVVAGLAGLVSRAWAIPQPPHHFSAGIGCPDCHIPYASINDPAAATGVASVGSNAAALVDSTKHWTDAQWTGATVTFTSGANLGVFREVISSGGTSLGWERPLAAPLAPGDGYRLGKTTYRDIETKCKSCHNPVGQASATADVGLHVVGAGTVVGCGKCHDPHNTEPNSGEGRGLVRETVRWPTARNPTPFPSGGVSDFITGGQLPGTPAGQAYQGICETCHTKTAYHRNNDTGDHTHNAQAQCTTCHEHSRGFTVSCTGCHALPKDNGDGIPAGGRRAVIGEFPQGSAHGHFGGELDAADCRVCHSQDTHTDGYVDLIDPDDANVIYRFEQTSDLSSDPDVSDFCMHCHDTDGATRLATPFDPFGDGNAPPDVASLFEGSLRWEVQYGDMCFGVEGTGRRSNSHHDIATDDQLWSGAKVECLNCHGAHTAAAEQKMVDPQAPTTPWVGTSNGFCLGCHAGGAGPANPNMPAGVTPPTVALRGLESCGYTGDPWWVDHTWSNSAHGRSSKRGWPGYSGAPAYEMNCVDCHDSHGSWTPVNTAGNPYMIRDNIDGGGYVDDGTRTAGVFGPPWARFGESREIRIAVNPPVVDWGPMCETCHAGWRDAYDFHGFCDGCQTCHGHGQAFGESDFGGGPNNARWCP